MIRTVVIDDDPFARHLLISIIRQNFVGLTIVGSADCVESGLEMIAEHDPDLVFLDVEMPDGTGFDLLECLPSRRFNLAMLSSSYLYREQAYGYQARQFFPKPICLNDLQQFITKLLHAGFQDRLPVIG